jgi:hypothetical protein
LPLFLTYTRIRFRRIAKKVAREIRDYTDSGYKVAGVIGIDGSPTCGVNLNIDLKRAFDFYAEGSVKELNRKDFNSCLYQKCLSSGSGVFILELKRSLKKKGLDVPFYSYSLIDESEMKTSNIWEVII